MKAARNYSIKTFRYSDCRIVWLGDVKAALLFPPMRAGEYYVLYPHPATYPGLTFQGLPAPLRPEIMRFATLAAVYAFLGLPAEMALAA